MIIYNVTVNIEKTVAEEWKQWMIAHHIPEVMATGYFEDYKMMRVVSEEPDNTGITFAIQYRCANMKALHQYTVLEAPRLQRDHKQRYEGQFVAFRTILEEV
jgi:hypothetical protein